MAEGNDPLGILTPQSKDPLGILGADVKKNAEPAVSSEPVQNDGGVTSSSGSDKSLPSDGSSNSLSPGKRELRLEKITALTDQVFREDPDAFSNPKTREIYFSRLRDKHGYSYEETDKIKEKLGIQDPPNNFSDAFIKALGLESFSLGNESKQVSPYGGVTKEETPEKFAQGQGGMALLNPVGAAKTAMTHGIEEGWKQLKSVERVYDTEGDNAAAATAAAGILKMTFGALNILPPVAAFTVGVNAVSDTPAAPAAELAMAPVSKSREWLGYEQPESEGNKALVEIADFLGMAGLFKGTHVVGKKIKAALETPDTQKLSEALSEFAQKTPEEQKALANEYAKSKVENVKPSPNPINEEISQLETDLVNLPDGEVKQFLQQHLEQKKQQAADLENQNIVSQGEDAVKAVITEKINELEASKEGLSEAGRAAVDEQVKVIREQSGIKEETSHSDKIADIEKRRYQELYDNEDVALKRNLERSADPSRLDWERNQADDYLKNPVKYLENTIKENTIKIANLKNNPERWTAKIAIEDSQKELDIINEINKKYDAEVAALKQEKTEAIEPNIPETYQQKQEIIEPTEKLTENVKEETTGPEGLLNSDKSEVIDPIEIPTGVTEGKTNTRGVARQIENDPMVAPSDKAKIPDEAREYIIQPNKISEAEAKKFVKKYGTEVAISAWADKNNGMNGGVRSKLGQTIYKSLNEAGRYEEANAMLINLAREATDAGQHSSAFQGFKELEPLYTLEESVRQYEAATGQTIPAELKEKFRDLEVKISAAEIKLRELKDKATQREAEMSVIEIREATQRSKTKKTVETDSLSPEKRTRKAELARKYRGMFNDISNIPRLLADKEFIEYNKLILEEAAGDFAKFVRKVVAELGDKVRPHARELFKAAGGELPKPEINEAGKLSISKELIRDIVEEGVENADDLVRKVHDIIKEDLPEVTEREIKEAVSEYGKTANPSKDMLDAEIRRLKRDARLELGLDDATLGKGVKRSGLQRDKPTDYQRELQRKINEELKNHPQDQASIEKKWASALDRAKTNLRNRIADLTKRIEDIKEGVAEPLPSKKRGFELDEEARRLTDIKNDLKEQLEALEPKQEISTEQRIKVGIAAAERTLKTLEDKLAAGDASYTSGKKPPVTSPELTAWRERVKEAREALKQLREVTGEAERHRFDLYKKRLAERIKKVEQQIADKDFAVKPKIKKPMDEEILQQQAKLDKLKFERDVEIEKATRANRSFTDKMHDIFVDAVNLPKSLMASADLSAPLRQGAILTMRHPVMAKEALRTMFKHAFSKEAQEKWLTELHASEMYPYMKRAKLYLAEPSVSLKAKEESFMSNIAGEIPVWGKVVKGSERAYVGYLNKLRTDVFTQFYEALKRDGIPPELMDKELTSMAKFLNESTGRGDLPGNLNKAAPFLNSLFFSPRYVASRINLLNPVTYAKLPPRARAEALKSMGAYIGVGLTVLAIAKASGLQVEADPRSSDFGKIKSGNTRYDIWAGFSQIIRTIVQFSLGQKKSTTTGIIKKLEGGKYGESRWDVLGSFTRAKVSPVLGGGINLAEGEDMVGNKTTLTDETIKLLIPMYANDALQIYQSEGVGKAAEVVIPSLFGVGVQDYGLTKGEVEEEMQKRREARRNKRETSEERRNKQKENRQKERDELELKEKADQFDINYIPKD